MSAFIILVLVAVNIALYLRNMDLKAELHQRPRKENSFELSGFDSMRFGVPPEGVENRPHRRTQFPKL